MKYLEKYAFELIPNILKLNDFPEEINDESIMNYFNLSLDDKENVLKLHKKNYIFNPK